MQPPCSHRAATVQPPRSHRAATMLATSVRTSCCRRSRAEVAGFAAALAFQWAFEVARRSALRRVLFIEDDGVLDFPERFRADLRAAFARMPPSWRYLALCKASAEEGRDSPSTPAALELRRGTRHGCSRGFVLSAHGLATVANATAPIVAPIDSMMAFVGHSYHLFPGPLSEGSSPSAPGAKRQPRGTDLFTACVDLDLLSPTSHRGLRLLAHMAAVALVACCCGLLCGSCAHQYRMCGRRRAAAGAAVAQPRS